MKVIVTHTSPDLDAITSVWLIKRFLQGWENASVQFVPAGERIAPLKPENADMQHAVEHIDSKEVIHVDTGLGPLDHHQTSDDQVCGASLTWDYIKIQNSEFRIQNSDKLETKVKAIDRMVKIVVDIDHFKEVFWDSPTADYHEFSLFGILEGLKVQKPDEDLYYVDFVMQCLDAILHNFENRIWAEKEIAEKGIKFSTQWGDGIGFETINDTVIKLAQKMGYAIVIRKDPRKGYVRIKGRPGAEVIHKNFLAAQREKDIIPAKLTPTLVKQANSSSKARLRSADVHSENFVDSPRHNLKLDLTLVYEKLKKMDPQATWFLHVSKKMLLNGTVKNPKMKPTTLSLQQIIQVLEKM